MARFRPAGPATRQPSQGRLPRRSRAAKVGGSGERPSLLGRQRYTRDILWRAGAFIANLAQPAGPRKPWRGRIRVAAEIHPHHIVLPANHKTMDFTLHNQAPRLATLPTFGIAARLPPIGQRRQLRFQADVVRAVKLFFFGFPPHQWIVDKANARMKNELIRKPLHPKHCSTRARLLIVDPHTEECRRITGSRRAPALDHRDDASETACQASRRLFWLARACSEAMVCRSRWPRGRGCGGHP